MYDKRNKQSKSHKELKKTRQRWHKTSKKLYFHCGLSIKITYSRKKQKELWEKYSNNIDNSNNTTRKIFLGYA